MARERLDYNQQISRADTSKIFGIGLFLGLIAWGLDDVTHGASWVGLAVLLVASWIYDTGARNRLADAWNMRVSADEVPGMTGAPTPACILREGADETDVRLAVPLVTGGIVLISRGGVARQYPPSEILEIDRSLPYSRIQITTTSSTVILVSPQDWNVHSWQGLKDRDTFAKSLN